jgi:hypothetical protein
LIYQKHLLNNCLVLQNTLTCAPILFTGTNLKTNKTNFYWFATESYFQYDPACKERLVKYGQIDNLTPLFLDKNARRN